MSIIDVRDRNKNFIGDGLKLRMLCDSQPRSDSVNFAGRNNYVCTLYESTLRQCFTATGLPINHSFTACGVEQTVSTSNFKILDSNFCL